MNKTLRQEFLAMKETGNQDAWEKYGEVLAYVMGKDGFGLDEVNEENAERLVKLYLTHSLMTCDACREAIIPDGDGEVIHSTTVYDDGSINGHAHLCMECFVLNFGNPKKLISKNSKKMNSKKM